VKKVYVPKQCLQNLVKLKKKDGLQETALHLVEVLSKESNITIADFGIHGSIALNMHTLKSDIDLVVYGAQNFRKLERTMNNLVEGGLLTYRFNNRLDVARRYKLRYQDKTVMYNAIRRPEEITEKYGTFRYTPLRLVNFTCKVEDDTETMFRPAIYKIEDYHPAKPASDLTTEQTPSQVVSMIGCYRNVARAGDIIRVSGVLEQVKSIETDEIFHQVVVGTGTNEEERIWPLLG
jgi:predicted nucleotidyltransferase